MRCLVYSSNRLFGECLSCGLSERPEISAASACHHATAVAARAEALGASFVLVDLAVPEGRQVVPRITRVLPEVCIIGLSVDDRSAEAVVGSARLGCIAVVPQDAGLDTWRRIRGWKYPALSEGNFGEPEESGLLRREGQRIWDLLHEAASVAAVVVGGGGPLRVVGVQARRALHGHRVETVENEVDEAPYLVSVGGSAFVFTDIRTQQSFSVGTGAASSTVWRYSRSRKPGCATSSSASSADCAKDEAEKRTSSAAEKMRKMRNAASFMSQYNSARATLP